MRSPHQHQKEALIWAKGRKRIALFWEMRLGKTLVALRWAKQWNTQTLIVCPLDVIETWLEEMRLEGIKGEWVQGYTAQPDPHADWVLCSFQTLRNNSFLQTYPWGCVIVDESTGIRNPKAQITKTMMGKFKRVPAKAILSGTPAPEGPLDYVMQMLWTFDSFLGCRNYWNLRAKHFEPDHSGFDWMPKSGTLPAMLLEISGRASVLTRRNVNMGGELVVENRRLTMPAELRTVYNNAELMFELPDEETNYMAVVHSWLSRLAGGCHPAMPSSHKVNALKELLQTDLKGQQVVVWFTFLSEMDEVAKMLNKTDLKYGIIRGDVKPGDRAEVNQSFQSHRIDVLLCQTQCARFGRNFSAADTSVYFSLPWSLLDYRQSRDRVVHPSKTTPTLAIHLLSRDSVDEDVLLALNTKGNVSSTFKAMVGRNMARRLGKR